MLKFAANLSMLYPEVPFLKRFESAARSGFHAVEFLLPYTVGLEAVRTAVQSQPLSIVLFNLPAGDWDNGERGRLEIHHPVITFPENRDPLYPAFGSLGNCRPFRLSQQSF